MNIGVLVWTGVLKRFFQVTAIKSLQVKEFLFFFFPFWKYNTGKLCCPLVYSCLTEWRFFFKERDVCVILCSHGTHFAKWMFFVVGGCLLTTVICTCTLPWLVLIWDCILFIARRDRLWSLLDVSCSFRVKLNSILIVFKGILVLGSSALVCAALLLFEYLYSSTPFF